MFYTFQYSYDWLCSIYLPLKYTLNYITYLFSFVTQKGGNVFYVFGSLEGRYIIINYYSFETFEYLGFI